MSSSVRINSTSIGMPRRHAHCRGLVERERPSRLRTKRPLVYLSVGRSTQRLSSCPDLPRSDSTCPVSGSGLALSRFARLPVHQYQSSRRVALALSLVVPVPCAVRCRVVATASHAPAARRRRWDRLACYGGLAV